MLLGALKTDHSIPKKARSGRFLITDSWDDWFEFSTIYTLHVVDTRGDGTAISDDKRWTHGGEKGAHNYIENLGAKKNGQFITQWEADALKSYFTFVRNPLGHGPGNEPMPEFTTQQTNWAIETCMSWIKTLIGRL